MSDLFIMIGTVLVNLKKNIISPKPVFTFMV